MSSIVGRDLSNIIKYSIHNPNRVLKWSQNTINRILSPVFRKRLEEFSDSYTGFNPLKRDWDNLIILDACRIDKAKLMPHDNSSLESKWIRSSTSIEYIENYIMGENFHDTIYVSANPFVPVIEDGVFFDISTPYEKSKQNQSTKVTINNTNKKWSPETVSQLAKKVHSKNPNKRLVIHYMQPHAPYFGDKAKKLRKVVTDKYDVRFWAWEKDLSQEDSENKKVMAHLLPAAKHNMITSQQLSEVYCQNLEIAMGHAKSLAEDLGGKSIITSDHGEMLGEPYYFNRCMYGHNREIYSKQLRNVPWLTLDYNSRRKIKEGDPKQNQIDKNIDMNLQALGYK